MSKELNRLKNADLVKNTATNIQGICADPANITGEVFAQRAICNATAIQVVTYIMGGTGVMNTMFRDEITAVNDQLKKDGSNGGASNNPWGNWSEAASKVDADETATAQLVNQYYGEGSKTIVNPPISADGRNVLERQPLSCALAMVKGTTLQHEGVCAYNRQSTDELWQEVMKPNVIPVTVHYEWWSHTKNAPEWVQNQCRVLPQSNDIYEDCVAFTIKDLNGNLKASRGFPHSNVTPDRWTK